MHRSTKQPLTCIQHAVHTVHIPVCLQLGYQQLNLNLLGFGALDKSVVSM